MTASELFGLACTGKMAELEKYYANGGEVNVRYEAFGKTHSLLMGAYNTGEWITVDYLLEKGETLTEEEKRYMQNEYYKMVYLEKLAMEG